MRTTRPGAKPGAFVEWQGRPGVVHAVSADGVYAAVRLVGLNGHPFPERAIVQVVELKRLRPSRKAAARTLVSETPAAMF